MASENRSGPVRTRRVDPGELKRQTAGGFRASGAGRGTGGAGKAAQRQRPSGAGRTAVGAGKAGSQTPRRKPARAAAAPEVFYVDGIEVRLQRKQVKNLNLRIARDGGHVDASAPAWMTPADVADFVHRKHDWIQAQMERVSATPMAQASQASKAEVAQWRAVVQACVPALVAAWEPIMGVKAGQLAYRNMTSRWGSCQPSTGRICINVRLALYPPECLEYVVVHELCHLLERGHGPRFHQLMDRFMPDWKQRRDKLR